VVASVMTRAIFARGIIAGRIALGELVLCEWRLDCGRRATGEVYRTDLPVWIPVCVLCKNNALGDDSAATGS
jgi:hypothetical protein